VRAGGVDVAIADEDELRLLAEPGRSRRPAKAGRRASLDVSLLVPSEELERALERANDALCRT
jgi:hypothetical protein